MGPLLIPDPNLVRVETGGGGAGGFSFFQTNAAVALCTGYGGSGVLSSIFHFLTFLHCLITLMLSASGGQGLEVSGDSGDGLRTAVEVTDVGGGASLVAGLLLVVPAVSSPLREGVCYDQGDDRTILDIQTNEIFV